MKTIPAPAIGPDLYHNISVKLILTDQMPALYPYPYSNVPEYDGAMPDGNYANITIEMYRDTSGVRFTLFSHFPQWFVYLIHLIHHRFFVSEEKFEKICISYLNEIYNKLPGSGFKVKDGKCTSYNKELFISSYKTFQAIVLMDGLKGVKNYLDIDIDDFKWS